MGECDEAACCGKCGNRVLPPRMDIAGGITSQACPICGEQNYGFLECHQQRNGGAEIEAEGILPQSRRVAEENNETRDEEYDGNSGVV